MDSRFYRVIDANLNRSREALRVAEDVARFVFDARSITGDLKAVRHAISEGLAALPHYRKHIVMSRSSENDVGKPTRTFEVARRDYHDVLFANLERAKESLRVLEELFKLADLSRSEVFKALRYRVYAIEKRATRLVEGLPHSRPKEGRPRRAASLDRP